MKYFYSMCIIYLTRVKNKPVALVIFEVQILIRFKIKDYKYKCIWVVGFLIPHLS